MKRIKALAIMLIPITAITFFFSSCASNGSQYDVSTVEQKQTVLTGKTIYWLGSSVTLGFRSKNVSMADYIAARNGATCVKEAVTGTTLIDKTNKEGESYITRLKNTKNFSTTATIDAFVCQISTNDAKKSNQQYWGAITADNVTDITKFDVETTLGAMEYVVAYATDTWSCPVYFYAGAKFNDKGKRSYSDPKGSDYETLIEKTKQIAEKWNKIEGYDVRVIDLFNDAEFNDISDADYRLYMHDPVHPFKAGYLLWWTPAFEKVFLKDFS